MAKIAVITKNKEQFDNFLRDIAHEDREHFVCVDSPEKIYGYEFKAVIRVGEYYLKTNWQKLYDFALMRIRNN